MKNLLLYILFIILIYSIIKLIPNNKLRDIDILLISIITVFICSTLKKYNNNEHYQNSNEINNKNIKESYSSTNSNLSSKTNEIKIDNKITVEPTEVKTTKVKDKSNQESKQVGIKQLSKSIETINNTISFPFDLQYIKSVYNDFNNMKKNDTNENKIKQKIKENSKKSEYYEILIQFIQTNMEQFYKYLNKNNFNKINEFIMDIKTRRNMMKDDNMKDKTESRELSPLMKKYLKSLLKEGKYIDDYGFIKNMIDNDMKYSIYRPKDHEMLGTYDPTFTNKWDNDYVLLNTDKWRPTIGHNMYKCKQEVKCPVCPTMTSGYPVKLKEFDMARKILPPDNINVDYINEKLLTGLA